MAISKENARSCQSTIETVAGHWLDAFILEKVVYELRLEFAASRPQ